MRYGLRSKYLQLMMLLAASFIISTSVFAADEAGNAGKSFAFSELGQKASEKADSSSLGIKAVDNGAEIVCKLQALEASVTKSGISIKSISSIEGGGMFSMKVAGLGRVGHGLSYVPLDGTVSVSDKYVKTTRPDLVEEYTVSGDGIRQDFIVSRKPEGNGNLSLSIGLSAATAKLSNSGLKIRLSETGREFAYSKLLVTDATGKTLPAEFKINSPDEFLITVDDSNATYPVRIDPTISDANWVSMGGFPGTNGVVRSIVIDSSNHLYVGGEFSVAGNVKASHIAKWDGASWSALDSGVNGAVYSLAIDSSGSIYACGSFNNAGGVAANNIAKWDGESWSALGSGVTNPSVLASDNSGNIYVGGNFITAGGISANHIAKWDGASWSALGSGTDGNVNAITFDSTGNLYAGGIFWSAGGVSLHNHVAKWDGSSWSALGSGPLMQYWVTALVIDSSGILYAGGSFTSVDGVSVNHIAKWNGSTWSALGSGVGSPVSSLSIDSSGNLYAGGSTGDGASQLISKWNGTSWTALGSNMKGNVYSLAIDSAGILYAGGQFTSPDNLGAIYISKWNGTSLEPLCLGMNGEVNALAIDHSGNLYTGGDFSATGDIQANGIAKWDGVSWSPLGSGTKGPVSTMAIDHSGNLYVGGWFTTAGGISCNNIAKWNGVSWSSLGSGMNDSVSTIAIDHSGNLYAGGWFTTAGGVSANYIAKWNGVSWSSLGSGMNDSVSTIAIDHSGNLYAGGSFWTAGGIEAHHIAKWNGTSWNSLGLGIGPYDGNVTALAIDSSGILYAGGGFTTAGEIPCNNIAKWNGVTWSALGSWMNEGGIKALAFDSSGTLYAGGDFTSIGGISANYIAKWDGLTWSALGSGIDWGDIGAICFDSSGDLYAGGHISIAGGKVSAYLAKCLFNCKLSYVAGANGSINGTTPQTVKNSEDAYSPVTATPDTDYYFFNWTGTGGYVSTDNPLLVTNVTQDMTITANFAHNTETLIVNKVGTGTVAITASGEVTGTFDTQTVHEITATDSGDSHFVNWTLSGTGSIDNANSATANITLTSLHHGMTLTATANFFDATTNTLDKAVPTAVLSDLKGGSQVFKINVPDSLQKYLTVTLTGFTGDCDLYTRYDMIPSIFTYDYKSTKPAGQGETITILNPLAGDYYFVVYAYDGYDGAVLTADYGTDWTGKPANLTTTAGSPADRQIVLGWDPVPGAASYEIFRSDVDNVELSSKINAEEVADTTYNDNFTVPGTYHYYYWVRALDVSDVPGEFSDSKLGTTTEGAEIPLANGTAKTAIAGPAGSVKTFKIPVLAGYNLLEIKISGLVGDCDFDVVQPGGETVTRSVSGTSNEIVQITGNPLTDGNWLIHLYGQTAYSGLSLLAKYSKLTVAPVVPTGINASDGLFPDKIVVTWIAVAGAASYEVWRGIKPLATDAKDPAIKIGEVSDNMFEDNSPDVNAALPGTLFYYFVKAKNTAGTSVLFSAGNSGYLTKVPAIPAYVTASNGIYFDKILVTWPMVVNATSYKLYRSPRKTISGATFTSPCVITVAGHGFADGDTVLINGVGGTIGTLLNGKTFSITKITDDTFSVPASTSGKTYLPGGTAALIPATPIATVAYDSRLTTYSYADSADGSDPDPNPDNTYYYWVSAVNANGGSAMKLSGTVGSIKKTGPTTVTATAGTLFGKVRVSWTAVPGATAYDVYRYNDKLCRDIDNDRIFADKTGIFYDDTEADVGSSASPYYYKVKAKFNTYYTSLFNVTAALGYHKAMPGPATVTASAGTYFGKIRVNWSAVAGATNYDVYRYTDKDCTALDTTFADVADLFKDDITAAVWPTVYYYKVKAKYNGFTTNFSPAASGYHKSVNGPASITATAGTLYAKVRVKWSAVTGATGYELFRGATSVIVTDKTTWDDIPGDTLNYVYTVRAKFGGYTSAPSIGATGYAYRGTAISSLATPTLTASKDTYANMIRLTWTEIPLAENYIIYRSTSSSFSTVAILPAANKIPGLSHDDDTAAPGILYYYWIKSNNDTADATSLSSATPVQGRALGAATLIESGDPQVGLAGAKNSCAYFSIDVPAGKTRLVATLTGTNNATLNDCDIYAKFAACPTTASYNAKGIENTSGESITISNPAGGTWYFMLYGVSEYDSVTLKVTYYTVTDIVLTQVPLNDQAIPFTASFKGRVVDESGNTGISGLSIQVRNPLTGLASWLPAKTDASGYFTYSAPISTEGEHTFDFFFTTIPDAAKGTASHTVATRKGCLESNNFFDFSGYLQATPVPIAPASLFGLQNFLNIRNGWDESGTVAADSQYERMWMESTIAKASTNANLVGKLDDGLYMFFYGVEGAGAGNDTDKTIKSALNAAPYAVHVAPDTTTVLDNLKAQGIIDDAQYNAITVDGKIVVVAVAALSNPGEGLDGNYDISLLAREQLEVLAKLAGNDGTTDFSAVKYSDATGKKVTVTLSNGRQINVVGAGFVK